MTEQERNVLLNELRQQESQREKQIKRERFRRLNPYAKKGAVVFAGSSLMEQFPLYEFLQDDDLHCTLYNRGIGGFTTTELLEAMDECILELQPAHLFLNIGTNDLNGPDYDRAAMLGRYEEIVQQIRKKLPETKLYLLAYYPVNPTVAEDPGLIECFRWRTNERIREASEGVQALARKYGAEFLDLNKELYDAAGNLKAEYTIEGMHLYANGYRPVMDALLPLLLYCVLPCVVLKSFCIEYSAKGAVELAVSIAAGAGVLLLSMAVSWLFFRKDPMAQIGVAFSNAGFMGLPLVTAVLGGEAVFYAAGFVALLNALQWTYGQAKLSGDKKYIQLGAVLKNPLVLSLLGGVMIYFCRIPVPQILRTPMGAIAGMNAPLAMIVLGVYLARTDLKAIFTRPRLYALSAVRLVVIPLLTIVCLMLLPAGWRQIGTVLIIVNAAPIGSNIAVYAQRLGLDSSYAVQMVCLSTLLSLITLPVMLSLAAVFGFV